MAYLTNPKVQIGASIGSLIDLTEFCTSATLTQMREALEDTVFGMDSREYQGGLYANELSLSVYADFGASGSYAALKDLVGTKIVVKVNPTDAADSATNPGFILEDTYLESLPVINGSVGELSTWDITTTGGSYSVDTTA